MNCNTQVVTISKIVNGGYGLAKTDEGKTLFVRYALPGETVSVELTEEKKRFCFGHVVEVHSPVSGRTSAPCPYYGVCGGCNLQHADYATQKGLKDAILEDLLARSPLAQSTLEHEALKPILGAGNPFGYRQRIRLKIDDRDNPGFAHFRSHKVIEVDKCLLAAEPVNGCLAELRSHGDFKLLAASADEIELCFDQLTGAVALRLLLRRPPRPADRRRALGLTVDIEVLDRVFFSGRNFAQEGPFSCLDTQSNLLGFELEDKEPITLRWEMGGFSQVNAGQNLKMIDLVRRFSRPHPTDRILDLYCGMGNFSLVLARQAAEVLGIEVQGSAIRSARRNAEENGLTNCTFIKSEVASACRELAADNESFATVVCDPPRRGLGVLAGVAGSLARRRMVYISCDPATLCRDLQELVGCGFSIQTIQPLDMFPQTHHLETVVVLEKNRA
jgi:23S rRNA (uracil1939-C5)-methyltransferase